MGGTFVSVGNATQPFPRLLKAVATLGPHLPQPITVQFGSNNFANPTCSAVDFLSMEAFAAQIGSAELLILHAGAGSIISAIQAGKIPIVAPRRACYGELVDDHQLEFARALAAAGKIVVVEDMSQLAAAVNEVRSRHVEPLLPTEPPVLVSMVGGVLAECAKNCES